MDWRGLVGEGGLGGVRRKEVLGGCDETAANKKRRGYELRDDAMQCGDGAEGRGGDEGRWAEARRGH